MITGKSRVVTESGIEMFCHASGQSTSEVIDKLYQITTALRENLFLVDKVVIIGPVIWIQENSGNNSASDNTIELIVDTIRANLPGWKLLPPLVAAKLIPYKGTELWKERVIPASMEELRQAYIDMMMEEKDKIIAITREVYGQTPTITFEDDPECPYWTTASVEVRYVFENCDVREIVEKSNEWHRKFIKEEWKDKSFWRLSIR